MTSLTSLWPVLVQELSGKNGVRIREKIEGSLSPLDHRSFIFAVSYSSLSYLAVIPPGNSISELPWMIKASPKKTRRRGLRRITSALTKAALVGIVAVSTVKPNSQGQQVLSRLIKSPLPVGQGKYLGS